MAGASPQRFAGFDFRAGVPAHPVVNEGQRIGRPRVAGERCLPRLERFRRTVLVAGHAVVVLVGDEESLALADAVLQAEREPRELFAALPFAETSVNGREGRVRGGEVVGIELDRLIEERDRLELAAPPPFFEPRV